MLLSDLQEVSEKNSFFAVEKTKCRWIVQAGDEMKNIIEELRNGERGPQDTPVDNNPHYKELQHLQSRNKAELIECLSEKQKAKLEKYCDTTLEMSPYPNAKPLPRDLLCT